VSVKTKIIPTQIHHYIIIFSKAFILKDNLMFEIIWFLLKNTNFFSVQNLGHDNYFILIVSYGSQKGLWKRSLMPIRKLFLNKFECWEILKGNFELGIWMGFEWRNFKKISLPIRFFSVNWYYINRVNYSSLVKKKFCITHPRRFRCLWKYARIIVL